MRISVSQKGNSNTQLRDSPIRTGRPLVTWVKIARLPELSVNSNSNMMGPSSSSSEIYENTLREFMGDTLCIPSHGEVAKHDSGVNKGKANEKRRIISDIIHGW